MPDEIDDMPDDATIDPDFDAVDWFDLPLEARLYDGNMYDEI